MCHGFSAAVGKAGALVAGVVFALVSDRTKFWISGACGFAGVILTYITIPDLTGLDLREGDKRWLAILDGAHDSYTGEAVNPKHLSWYERMLGYGKLYNAEKAAEDDAKHPYHTDAEVVGGLVVATHSEPGGGPDNVHVRAPLGGQVSFQAKSLSYM